MFTTLVFALLVAAVAARGLHYDGETHHKKSHHHAKHHKNTEASPFTGADFVLYDEEGIPYVNCVAKEGGRQFTKKCSLPDEQSMGPRGNGLACHTVMRAGEVLMQGCWVHQESALSQCSVKECKSNGDPFDGVQFCCCRGHECNQELVTKRTSYQDLFSDEER